MPEIFYVRPNCCADVQDPNRVSVYLAEVSGYLCDCTEEDDREPPQFRWVIRGQQRYDSWRPCSIEVTYCPYCGQKLPELQDVDPPGPVVAVSDGGYYCDTCSERLDSCWCYPLESQLAPVGGEPLAPRVKFVSVEPEAIVFRVCFKARAAFVPEAMQAQAEQIAAEHDRKIVKVSSDAVRTRFVVEPAFTDDLADELTEHWWYRATGDSNAILSNMWRAIF